MKDAEDLQEIKSVLSDEHALVLANRIGSGAYGSVYRATRCSKDVAVKIMSTWRHDAYETLQLEREIRHMRECEHENVLMLDAVIRFPKWTALVTPLFDTDLARFLRSNPGQLTLHHRQHMMRCCLLGLRCLHAKGILHRDVKPENILVNRNCHTTIADLGMSRRRGGSARAEAEPSGSDGSTMSHYVTTRWYRAPELLCQSDYDESVDIWSLGCVQSQILRKGVSLFPGRSSAEQLQLILGAYGCRRESSDEERGYRHWCSVTSADTFDRHLRASHADAVEEERVVLQSMLAFDRLRRVSAADLLQMPFFSL